MTIDLRRRAEQRSFWTGRYERRLVESLRDFLKPGFVVFDVGANVGFYAVSLGLRLRELGGALYAYEPVPANYVRLVENVNRNGLETTVTAFELALGARAGHVELEPEAGGETGNAVMVGISPTGTGTVAARMTRFDDIMQEQKIDGCEIAKLDVEGAELGVLQGAERILAEHRPIVLTELNHVWMHEFGWSFRDLQALLSPLEYRAYRYAGSGFVPKTDEGSGIETVLLIPADGRLGDRARRHFVGRA